MAVSSPNFNIVRHCHFGSQLYRGEQYRRDYTALRGTLDEFALKKTY